MKKPLCFVLMPFGTKLNAAGCAIDFDRVYREIVRPAIVRADLEPLRADEEMTGGIIHKPMFERLVLCEYAVADLTTANANVFYELGLRHAARPWSSVLVFAAGERLPFDVGLLRGLPYRLGDAGAPAAAKKDARALADRLIEAKKAAKVNPKSIVDSPIYQLIENYPDIDRTKTDAFRDRVQISSAIKARLARARGEGLDAVRKVEKDLGDLSDAESAAVIDLFLSYRAVEGFEEMIALYNKMPAPLAATAMAREQYALALNRNGDGEAAETVLLDLLKERGASSETCALLGRVYKDRWERAMKDGENLLARALLDKSIDAYLQGFQTDWRDAYPGVNAVTLMEMKEPTDRRQKKILPVVAYAVERRVERGEPDYWDWATLLELAVLASDEADAANRTGKALAAFREGWELKTTARNLRLIREARARRGAASDWIAEIEKSLLEKAESKSKKTKPQNGKNARR